MRAVFKTRADVKTVPVIPIEEAVFHAWCAVQPEPLKAWVGSTGFTAAAGKVSLVAGADGTLASVLVLSLIHI